ncbi:hypothetical protein MCHLDSM_03736 [Mycolicibacterium chlorophenolicum]|uniref:Uncharacterized protein n=1 Tax=Mycolicibacterium chlorophenolicum TaxID=37916 RepID=A0A0J6VY00_9MYCO|nr:hypothetical protein MCHLDSM_03736 [Mycolicibacterium chlorophenolicum]
MSSRRTCGLIGRLIGRFCGEAANEFSAVCIAVFEKGIDSTGVFNTVMDFV